MLCFQGLHVDVLLPLRQHIIKQIPQLLRPAIQQWWGKHHIPCDRQTQLHGNVLQGRCHLTYWKVESMSLGPPAVH
jgi:hypothetical protein